MSGTDPRGALRRLVEQLRAELEWASRTGIEVVIAKPPPRETLEPLEGGFPGLPVEAGRPAPPEEDRGPGALGRSGGREAVLDELPPAFEPDPDEPEEPGLRPPPVPPERARLREAPGKRPWDRYLPEEPASRGPDPESSRPSRPTEAPPARPSSLPAAGPPTPSREDADGPRLALADSLEAVRAILGDCTRCKLHRAGRRQIVFGVGNPRAEVMFVGEGPGRQEDLQGEPFVGDAGQLLTRIIENGMRIRRSDVYIANIVKCRPPQNRDPEPDEVDACEPFLRAQIQQIRPRVIVALGKYAAQTLLRTQAPISRLRGRWHVYEGIDLMPTYHPAFLLRNPAEKRPVWEDVKEVLRRIGRSPPS